MLNTADAGSPLYSHIDEAPSPNDADYIYCTENGGAQFELSNGSDPGVNTGHIIHLRGYYVGEPPSMEVSLFQAVEGVLATFADGVFDPDTPGTLTFELNTTQANNITDYTALELRIENIIFGKGTTAVYITQAYLELPDAPAGTAIRDIIGMGIIPFAR